MELSSSQLVLKLVLEELNVVEDWKEVNINLIRKVLASLNEKEIIGFSYYGLPGHNCAERQIHGPFLDQDIIDIHFAIENGSYKNDKTLISRVKKVLNNYKETDDFKKIALSYCLKVA